MNLGSLRTIPVAPRLFLAALWGIICSAILAAPLLATFGHLLPAALLYSSFSPVCHQDPGRSFELLGHQLAVCHRCSGIYFGLFLASLGFRTIDQAVCEWTPVGTHFMWHILNAAVLYLCVRGWLRGSQLQYAPMAITADH